MTTLTLRSIHDRVVACRRCTRLRAFCRQVGREKRRAYRDDVYWARPVPGFGDPRGRLLIVGLAPAAHGANRTGRMFTGDGAGGSGDFLMAALHRAGYANQPTSRHAHDGLTLSDAYITAAVRCAPPANKPRPEEIRACESHLDAEFEALPNVRVIIALGRIAFDTSLRLVQRAGAALRPRPQFDHGRVCVLPRGHALIGCYHPSRQNTHTGRLTPGMMDAVFKEAKRISAEPEPRYGGRV